MIDFRLLNRCHVKLPEKVNAIGIHQIRQEFHRGITWCQSAQILNKGVDTQGVPFIGDSTANENEPKSVQVRTNLEHLLWKQQLYSS